MRGPDLGLIDRAFRRSFLGEVGKWSGYVAVFVALPARVILL